MHTMIENAFLLLSRDNKFLSPSKNISKIFHWEEVQRVFHPPPKIVGGPGPQSSPLPHLPVIATLYKLFYLSFMDANIIQSVSNNVYLLICFLISSELPFFDATACCQMITRSNRVISQLYFKTSCKENFSSPWNSAGLAVKTWNNLTSIHYLYFIIWAFKEGRIQWFGTWTVFLNYSCQAHLMLNQYPHTHWHPSPLPLLSTSFLKWTLKSNINNSR